MYPPARLPLFVTSVALVMLAAACNPIPTPEATLTPIPASSTPAPIQTPSLTQTPLPPTPTSTVTPLAASVKVQINVRRGPGIEFAALGLLPAGMALELTGRNEAGTWFQVAYASGEGGKGWVSAAYVQADGAANLPVLDASGLPLSSGPTGLPATLTPTLTPASADNDSVSAPAISVIFSPLTSRQFTYTSDISAPQGDAEDWLAFTPYASLADSPARLSFSIACEGNGSLEVELWQNGAPTAGWGSLACGDRNKPIELKAGVRYTLELRAASGEGLGYISYTLIIRNGP